MRVSEIFNSFMGEQNPYGIGTPAVFIRFYGCSLQCNFCDTKYSWNGKFTEYTPEELAKKVFKEMERGKYDLICITGGEPLEQDRDEFLKLMAYFDKYKVVIETNGEVDFVPFIDNCTEHTFVIDYKMKSTTGRKYLRNYSALSFSKLRPNDVIKFVLKTKEDVLDCISDITTNKYSCMIAVGLSDKSEVTFSELFALTEIYGLSGRIKFNFQVHKLIGYK